MWAMNAWIAEQIVRRKLNVPQVEPQLLLYPEKCLWSILGQYFEEFDFLGQCGPRAVVAKAFGHSIDDGNQKEKQEIWLRLNLPVSHFNWNLENFIVLKTLLLLSIWVIHIKWLNQSVRESFHRTEDLKFHTSVKFDKQNIISPGS